MPNALDPLTLLDHEVELLAADTALAYAWFEGVPAARLLARVQLGRSAHDPESWDRLAQQLLVTRDQQDRVARAVARNLRAAQDEGPLAAGDAVVALLMLAATETADASLGEIFGADGHEHDAALLRVASRYEPRVALGARALRTAAFEACVRLATRRVAGPWPQHRILAAARAFASSAIGPFLVTENSGRLYPHDVDAAHARMVLVDRAPLQQVTEQNPMDLAKAVSALERTAGVPAGLDRLIADVEALLAQEGDVVLTAPLLDPELDIAVPSAPPSEGPVSTILLDWSQPDAASGLASAFENGLIAFPRLRQLVGRGGEPALDAIGAEMLKVTLHPTASAAFAELLAKSGRPRDVIRLVTYFAVTPDPLLAARALGECDAPELPTVLRAWLEAMLPADGETAPPGDDPGTSSAARIAACVSSLEPYPHLYGAVRPLLMRVSEPPPASG